VRDTLKLQLIKLNSFTKSSAFPTTLKSRSSESQEDLEETIESSGGEAVGRRECSDERGKRFDLRRKRFVVVKPF